MRAIRFFTTVHLLLFAYIVAALLFWGFSLNRQSIRIFEGERDALHHRIDSVAQPVQYQQELAQLRAKLNSRTKQYLGEGSTFLVMIIIGAAVVYSSFRRNIRLSRQQNNFMLAVTHELKSPIAAMKLNLQTLEKRRLTPEQQELLVERCIGEANRLNDLCNNMLIASQMEGRHYQTAREEIDFSELVEEAVEDYAARYPQRFSEDGIPGLRLSGDKLLLQMAVNNLLENAIKYSPAGTPITVTLHRSEEGLGVLRVADEGHGIPEAEKNKIFQKFYRIGNESTRRSKGTGLGLYLTRKIVTQHKGSIAVKNNTPTGSIFEICLPLGTS
jgi:signal transduction histidine kinase